MKLSEKLLVIAEWLENENNELLCEAEEQNNNVESVANAFVMAADVIKNAAKEAKLNEKTLLTAESLEEMAEIAAAFDASGDPLLEKQASVLDEILLTIAAPKDWAFNLKVAKDARMEELKKKYNDTKTQQDEMNKVSDTLKAIEKSPTAKVYNPLENPLSTRYCPDHSGVPIARIGDDTWQCEMDHKTYSFESGYETLAGNKVPGTTVSEQTPTHFNQGHSSFDTRNSKLGLKD